MASEHPDYYLSRVTEERSCAADAAGSKAATVHLELSEGYESVVDDTMQLSPCASGMGWAQ